MAHACSAGIHAAVMTSCSPDTALLVARNCHLAAFSALVLSGQSPHLRPAASEIGMTCYRTHHPEHAGKAAGLLNCWLLDQWCSTFTRFLLCCFKHPDSGVNSTASRQTNAAVN